MRNNVLVRFLGLFILTFAALAALWLFLAPLYNELIFTGANVLFQLDDPVAAEIEATDELWSAFHRNGQARQRVFEFDKYGTFFNVVLLLGLLLATPRMPWTKRLKRSGLALALLGLVHIVFVVVQTKAQFINLGLLLVPSQSAYWYNWAAVLLGTLGEQLLPLLIAAGFTWKSWINAFGLEWSPAPSERNSPCPCGSGRKYKRCCQEHGRAVVPNLHSPLSRH